MEQNKNEINKSRLEECSFRLYTIHKMRWELMSNDDFNNDYYCESNEILNELENKIWNYINGKNETY